MIFNTFLIERKSSKEFSDEKNIDSNSNNEGEKNISFKSTFKKEKKNKDYNIIINKEKDFFVVNNYHKKLTYDENRKIDKNKLFIKIHRREKDQENSDNNSFISRSMKRTVSHVI